MSVLVVSGTGTGVGKTVVSAAVAAVARANGQRVALVKAAQTGVAPGEEADLAAVGQLAGLDPDDLHEPYRFTAPLSPEAAARVDGVAPADLDRVADLVRALSASCEQVLVEGAGGLLVRFGPDGRTVADLAAALAAPVLVVTAAGLGTLNSTALTLEALEHRELVCAGLVVGAWPVGPTVPDLACRTNLVDLETLAGAPLAGVLPDGAGSLARPEFLRVALDGLGPSLGGIFDAADFRRRNLPGV